MVAKSSAKRSGCHWPTMLNMVPMRIRSVRSANVPKADQLDTESGAPGSSSFDPYAVLQVSKEASPEEIRQAYHRMAKLYHPDRIASFGLPEEVMDYVRTMLVRINLAFEQIGQ